MSWLVIPISLYILSMYYTFHAPLLQGGQNSEYSTLHILPSKQLCEDDLTGLWCLIQGHLENFLAVCGFELSSSQNSERCKYSEKFEASCGAEPNSPPPKEP